MNDAPNFGHHAASAFNVHIDGWGDGPLLIRHGRRQWWFEFSDMFGPTILRESDKEPADRQPTREDDPFWKPFCAWMKGGKRCRPIRDKRNRVKFWVCHWRREGGE